MYLLSLGRLTFQTTNKILQIIFIIILEILGLGFQLERKKQIMIFLTLKRVQGTLNSCFGRALCVSAGEEINQ